MIRSFTGPSKLTDRQLHYVQHTLKDTTASQWRSGGAYGVDTEVAIACDPCLLTLVVPRGHWFNESLLETAGVSIRFIDGGYRRRNEDLVGGSDILHAFLKAPDFYRSGEWMTVNIARKAGVPVIKHILPWSA